MSASSKPHSCGPLTAVEIANGGIMAGLSVALGVLSAVFPVFQIAFQIAAIVPIAMVSTAFRPRATIAVMVAAIVVSGAVGGAVTALQVAQSCVVGAAIGALHRRGVGRWGAGVVGLLLGALIGALSTGLLWVFEQSRVLLLDATRTSIAGYIEVLGRLPGLSEPAAEAQRMLATFLTYWWLWVPAGILFATFVTTVVSFILLGVVLSRLHYGSHHDRLSDASHDEIGDAPPAPLPLELHDVSFHYEATAPILTGIDLRVSAGEFVVIAGENGSGKSTLASLLAGASPTEGRITSPGPRALGRRGGTAFLTQRSEVQIVGDTVWEDLLWGIHLATSSEQTAVDMRARHCLERVGLGKKAHLQTRRLSGGELQRLALAGALMREPALLICDETTAMVDPSGRAALLSIFAELAQEGTCVIHVTHDLQEAAHASRLIRLHGGTIIFDGPPLTDPECARAVEAASDGRGTLAAMYEAAFHARRDGGQGAALPPRRAGSEVEHLWLSHVCHHYDVATPWEKPVLHDIDCIISPGQTLLITGENGSGKSTLARIMAGLITPTWGRCTLANRPMWTRVGAVAISHQFARLQLLRPTVAEDIVDAAGLSGLPPAEQEDRVTQSLERVGLPADFASRTIDQLSGGQMRRVVLAGLVAADPAVLILDEPFAGLDQASRRIIVEVLAEQRARGTALVIISHDVEGLAGLCDRHLILNKGHLIAAPDAPMATESADDHAASHESRHSRRPHRPSTPTMPRPLPWESGLSRMWLGTKIVCWAAASTALLLSPTWISLAITATLLLAASVVARVPRRAIPRFPAWFWAGMIGGMVGAWMGDGLLVFLRAFSLTIVIVWGTALILWTSPAAGFPSAIRHLISPLRWVGLPVKEWAHVMTMTLRSVPLMRDQSQAIADTLALRQYASRHYALRHEAREEKSGPSIFTHLADLTTASLSVAAQRASDLGRAMSMRGGIPPFSQGSPSLGWWDLWGALATVITLCGIVAGSIYFA